MVSEECLEFLAAHQPMPNRPNHELWSKYITCITFCGKHADPRCIPLLLGSMGDFEELGVYEAIQHVLSGFPRSLLEQHLGEKLQADSRSVRLWSTDVIRAICPNPCFLPLLEPIYKKGNEEDRLLVAAAIEAIGNEAAKKLAKKCLSFEKNPLVIEILAATLGLE